MLAQNFKTPADMGINDEEFDALRKVLGMLERGELVHEPREDAAREYHFDPQVPNGFCMDCSGEQTSCGTVACIGGWVAILMGRTRDDINHYVNSTSANSSLYALYWGRTDRNIQPSQAAIALRNYLTHGEPRWDEALAVT
jgi:hypothetical protein